MIWLIGRHRDGLLPTARRRARGTDPLYFQLERTPPMTQVALQPDTAVDRFPLSCPQQLLHSGDQGDLAGFFSQRFVLATGLRIAGRVHVAALQGALDDLVRRHEILRTVVVRDAE